MAKMKVEGKEVADYKRKHARCRVRYGYAGMKNKSNKGGVSLTSQSY